MGMKFSWVNPYKTEFFWHIFTNRTLWPVLKIFVPNWRSRFCPYRWNCVSISKISKLNPIPRVVWNYVNPCGGAIMARMDSSHPEAVSRHPKAQKWLPSNFFDLWLSIDTKNSTLWAVVLANLAVERLWWKIKILTYFCMKIFIFCHFFWQPDWPKLQLIECCFWCLWTAKDQKSLMEVIFGL